MKKGLFLLVAILILSGCNSKPSADTEKTQNTEPQIEETLTQDDSEKQDNKVLTEAKEDEVKKTSSADKKTTKVENTTESKKDSTTSKSTSKPSTTSTKTEKKVTSSSSSTTSSSKTTTSKKSETNTTSQKESTKKEETKKEESKPKQCTKHTITSNVNKYFDTKEECYTYYKSVINYWGPKWENGEISDEEYEKNCPCGYEAISCINCGKWALNFHYR